MPPRRRPSMGQIVGQTSPQPWTGGVPSGEDVAASVAFFESLGGPRPIYYEDIIAYLQFEVSTAGAFFGRLPKKQGIADAATRKAFADLKRVLREQVLIILRDEDLIATGALARSIHVREYTPTGRSSLRAIQTLVREPHRRLRADGYRTSLCLWKWWWRYAGPTAKMGTIQRNWTYYQTGAQGYPFPGT